MKILTPLKEKIKELNNEKGVTLIELVAAITILTIVVAPFLGLVVSSSKNNVAAREKSTATAFAQQEMEKIKADVGSLNALSEEGATPRPIVFDDGYLGNVKVESVTNETYMTGEEYPSGALAFYVNEANYFDIDNDSATNGEVNPTEVYLKLDDINYTLYYKVYSEEEKKIKEFELYSNPINKVVKNGVSTIEVVINLINRTANNSKNLYVNLDELTGTEIVKIYVVKSAAVIGFEATYGSSVSPQVQILNNGKKAFFLYDGYVKTVEEEITATNLYKVTIVVSKNNKDLCTLVSKVKK